MTGIHYTAGRCGAVLLTQSYVSLPAVQLIYPTTTGRLLLKLGMSRASLIFCDMP